MNSTLLPSRYFGMHRQGFAPARLTWPTYVNGRKRENISLKDRIGSFHVKSSGDFHGPPPILLKFGTLVGIVKKIIFGKFFVI